MQESFHWINDSFDSRKTLRENVLANQIKKYVSHLIVSGT